MNAAPAAPHPLPSCALLSDPAPDPGLARRLTATLRTLALPDPAPWSATSPQTGATPDLVLACCPAAALLQALRQQAWSGPPLLLIGAAPSPAEVSALGAAGLDGWWPDALLAQADELAAALAMTQARALRLQGAERDLQRTRQQLDERKWVDRAKGVLMSARGLDEQAAFTLLRGAAMHANLRVGELSRAVTEAASWAEAVNRAGQLRALSQRLVKLTVQRWAGVEPRAARSAQTDTQARLDETLRHLSDWSVQAEGAAAWAEALAASRRHGEALTATLQGRLSPALVRQADAQAEALLASAEALTAALQAASGRRALHIVNVCGRQRMRVQRIAKQALMAQQLDDVALRDGLPALLDDFEAALRELDEAPLSTPEIRESLSSTRDEWLRLLRGLHAMHTDSGRLSIVQAGDALLALFDRLTASYEHSLQVLMA